MKRRLSLLGSSMALASLVMLERNVALAATCVVGADPIQSAIDDPACTEILLSGGSYTQSVVIHRPVVIDGQGSLVSVAETAFTLTNGADVELRNLAIQADVGISVTGTLVSRVVVDTVNVDGASAAVVIDTTTHGAQILNSTLSSNGQALQVGSGSHANMRIFGNSISGRAQVNIHDSKIEQNTFSGADTRGCLRLLGAEDASVPSNDVLLRGNTFDRCNPYGVQIGVGVHDLTISRNAFNGGYDGVNTLATTRWIVDGHGIRVNDNDFAGNMHAGVYNAVDGTLDATCNWWNSATGPGGIRTGTGDQVSNAVEYMPFLGASFTANPGCGANAHGELPPRPDAAVAAVSKDAGAGSKHEGDAGSVGSQQDANGTNGNLEAASVAHDGESSAAEADGGCNQAGTSAGDVAGIAAAAVVVLARLRRRRRD